jgi:hypothetical protein
MTPQQQQYILINLETKEEFICEKVVIEGMDYYVSDEKITKHTKPCYCYNSIKNTLDKDIVFYQGVMPMYHYEGFKKIVATTSPSMDVPKVIDSIYDLSEVSSEVQEGTYTIQHKITYKHGFKDGYNKAKKTYTFTEDDMIEFIEWINESINPFIKNKNKWIQTCGNSTSWTTKQLLDIWKEQRIETIYFK